MKKRNDVSRGYASPLRKSRSRGGASADRPTDRRAERRNQIGAFVFMLCLSPREMYSCTRCRSATARADRHRNGRSLALDGRGVRYGERVRCGGRVGTAV